MSNKPTPKTPAWPPRSAPRLFLPDPIEHGAVITLDGQQAHYLLRVMRVRAGDTVILCDDATGEWAAQVDAVEKRRINLAPVEHLKPRETPPDLWLCPALLKKDRFDQTLEKATELGVAEIHPLVLRRCVADSLNLDRARVLVTEAAEQCARTALPRLLPATALSERLRNWPTDRTIFYADEEGGQAASVTFGNHTGPAAILIGPEGGFDPDERMTLRDHPNAHAISLGPRILRAETAALTAVALWMAINGDWVDDA